MRKTKMVLNKFMEITTGELLAVGFFTNILYPIDSITSDIFWQILFTSFLCALSTLIYPDDRISTRKAIMLTMIHYFIIIAIVLGCGYLFGWYTVTHIKSVVYMVLSITVIYGVISAISWKKAVAEANKLNERIQEYQKRV